MPLNRGTSKATVSRNIREMVAAGHPARQAVAAALREKDESAHHSTGDRKMDGIRQHKNMASGKKVDGESGNFGVEPFHQVNGGHEHPDAGMAHHAMADHERGIGRHISRGEGHMPAQAHPDHGPHHHRAEPKGGESFGVGKLPR